MGKESRTSGEILANKGRFRNLWILWMTFRPSVTSSWETVILLWPIKPHRLRRTSRLCDLRSTKSIAGSKVTPWTCIAQRGTDASTMSSGSSSYKSQGHLRWTQKERTSTGIKITFHFNLEKNIDLFKVLRQQKPSKQDTRQHMYTFISYICCPTRSLVSIQRYFFF